MKLKKFIDSALFVLIGFHLQVLPVKAGVVTFTIDPTRSSIALSGSVASSLQGSALGPYAYAEQGPGSLVTSYSGTIVAILTPTNIRLPGGGLASAMTNGTWMPAIGGGTTETPGSDPADYGVQVKKTDIVTAYYACRNYKLDITSPQTILTNGSFNAGLLIYSFVTNPPPAPSADYNITIPLSASHDTNGTSDMSDSLTNEPGAAYLTNGGGQLELFLPISITAVKKKSNYTNTFILTGTVVATAPATAWPLPLTASLQNGQVSLTWPSFPGPTFTVQTTQTLGTPWTNAPGVTTVQANTTTWTGAATNTAQFYRVQATF